ncbi:hypothetical protein [Massilia sp. TWP1-3-3]|uniref:hypothetical protein n=1 Tax=Massilia sp. TWP1-3-3 TaxID=2804573 RepID=UPI003CEDF730
MAWHRMHVAVPQAMAAQVDRAAWAVPPPAQRAAAVLRADCQAAQLGAGGLLARLLAVTAQAAVAIRPALAGWAVLPVQQLLAKAAQEAMAGRA